MCRGYKKQEHDRLNIKAFDVRLAFSRNYNNSHIPRSLTLHYLPRKVGKALEINGSNIRSNSRAFVALYRVVSPELVMRGGAMYSSRERMVVSEGLRFEIYMNSVKVLDGIFRKEQEQSWKIGCKCDRDNDDVEEVKGADVCVRLEDDVAIVTEKVEIGIRKRRRRRINGRKCVRLEEIPEEPEAEMEARESNGEEYTSEVEIIDGDVEMGGMRFVVDVGVWVVCFGFGYLVTITSFKCLKTLII